jgi:hypothetical protein
MHRFATPLFIAALGSCLIPAASASATGARGFVAIPPLPSALSAGRASRKPRRATTCLGTGTRAFIGVKDANRVAATDSAVLGGQSNIVCDDYSAIGGGRSDSISSAHDTALDSFIGGGVMNHVGSPTAFIGGGTENVVDGTLGAIGGGDGNTISTAALATIGGGAENVISVAQAALSSAGGDYSTIAGGVGNSITATIPNGGYINFISGGYGNAITGDLSVIGGGQGNSVPAFYGAIGGGSQNSVTAEFGTVAGGAGNAASGTGATVPGGSNNTAAGFGSFAAGTGAKAFAAGSFVWSDNAASQETVASLTPGQFLARATGGFALYTNANMTSGVFLHPGSGAWSNVSDRAMKTGILDVDDASILAKVAALPVSEWSYTSERGVRHIGPMAQDFYAAFRVGEDDRHITTIDEDGVALAAVKALHAENASLRAELKHLEREVAAHNR